MTEPSDDAQPQGDTQQRDPSDAPINPTGSEQQSDRDAAIAAVDAQVAAEKGDDDEPAEGEEGEQDDAEAEGDDDKDEDAADESESDDQDDAGDGEPSSEGDDEPPKKLSASVREAHRRQRSAARKLAKAEQVEQRNEERIKALDARDQEWTTFESELKRNPLQAIAGRMGITVPRLIAAYGEDAKGDVPEAVSLELAELRDELKGLRDERKERDEQRDKTHKEARYQAALDNDAKMLSGMVTSDDVADRYPYYSALPEAQRVSKARALQDHVVKHMPNPEQYSEDDLLEALDAKEKDRITKLEKAGVIKWLGRKRKPRDDDEPSGKSKRPRTPSAKKAASAAPKYKDMTDEQLRKAAADEVDRLRAGAQ